jgi:hypothetical protein
MQKGNKREMKEHAGEKNKREMKGHTEGNNREMK